MSSFTETSIFQFLIYPFLFLSVFRVSSVAETPVTNNGGFTLDLIRRDDSGDPYEKLRHAIQRSLNRKSILSLASRQSETSAKTTGKLFGSPLKSGGGEYIMKVSIGTPAVEQYGIADTASDLTWMQCLPCTRCYKQISPIFNPRNSKTYKKISCKTDICNAAGDTNCGAKRRCRYNILYGDNSASSGDLSEDTLSFVNATFPKTIFGCGHDTTGTFADVGSGIVGLGGGTVSIINQLNHSINGKFSYCLTSVSSNATSKISFGAAAVFSGSGAVKTPIVKKDPDTFYYLTLEAVTVDGQKLYYKSETTGTQPGNIIIDSGTTATFLDDNFVGHLEAAVEKIVKGQRVRESSGNFGLCYKPPVMEPKITMHFSGADVVIPAGGVFADVEKSVVCLTILRGSDMAIFGNLHQMNHKVGYDLVNKEVTFQPADCSRQ
ncbi:aspartic proteinase CDR1-like [Andrographis paniculata]|uniref:aspartic proteinase CDR1-like n=1 Tax=Andrographis paniculata TaxID=175694 RepID=UPI0021E94892|nr:aspartic proteinase CDR1-like [Andrographis paniculata]